MKKMLYILGGLNDNDIEWMISTGKKTKIPTGRVLIHEGRPIDAFYIVTDGVFSVTVAALDNRQVATVAAGEVLGEMSYIDSRPPSATVTAVEDAAVLSIPRQKLTQKLEQDTGFAARFYRAVAVLLADRLRSTVSRFGHDRSGAPEAGVDTPDNTLDPARFDRILTRLREV